MLYERINEFPVLAVRDYAKSCTEPIIANTNNEWTWMEYYGTGVIINDHPLKNSINMHGCGACKSDDVRVIYGKWCVSTTSGNAYWDYEIVCNSCGKFTARSFSEND